MYLHGTCASIRNTPTRRCATPYCFCCYRNLSNRIQKQNKTHQRSAQSHIRVKKNLQDRLQRFHHTNVRINESILGETNDSD
nr:MAG TPA: hypothetical protein [Caudoviricetes sp.]